MFRRSALVRSRYTLLRFVLLCLLAGGGFSVVYFWRVVLPVQLDTLRELTGDSPWDRSVARMSHNQDLEDDFDDDGLVADGVTSQSLDATTVQFDIQEQIAKDALEFGEQFQAMGFGSNDQEDRHIGVERPEIQVWEEEVMELDDVDGDPDLIEDDHVPGLVLDDVLHKPDHKHEHLATDRTHALLEEDLEAVARLAEEDAMRDAEEQEWAKLGDVDEAEEWQNEADVDWEQAEDELMRDMDKEEELKKQKSKKSNKKKRKSKKDNNELDEGDDDSDEEELITDMTTPAIDMMTTFEPSTIEPDEEIAREQEEEKDLFDAPETRKIGRLLLRLGLDGRNRRFRTALETHSNKKKEVLLTLSDSRYTMMVLNFYESTVLKHGIKNVLFGSLDGKLCSKLDALNIPCFIYARETIIASDIEKGIRRIFNRKIYYRSRMILEAIAMGYTVLYSDVDTSFFRNPFKDIADMCDECDVAFQQYSALGRKLSWGISYARPTISSLYLYYSIARKTFNKSALALPDRFINRLEREGRLKITRLPHKKCRSGIDFFQNYKFGWDNRCRGCVSMHCDETFSKEAKMYRLKELLLWNLNFDGYYSHRKRKYIQYDNPYVFHNGTETLIMEMKALRNALALGQILQRIVVLPRFHCFVPTPLEGQPDPEPPRTKWCNLHDVLRIEDFHRWFMGRYREHSYLSHPKVPRIVKKNISEIYYIGQKLPLDPGPDGVPILATNVTLVKPKSPLYGAQSEEVRLLFDQEIAPVLRFHSLYYGFSHFLSDDIAKGFNRRIKLGFDFRRRVHYSVRKLKVKRPEKQAAAGQTHGHSQVHGQAQAQPPVNPHHPQDHVPSDSHHVHDQHNEEGPTDHAHTHHNSPAHHTHHNSHTELEDEMFMMPPEPVGTKSPAAADNIM